MNWRTPFNRQGKPLYKVNSKLAPRILGLKLKLIELQQASLRDTGWNAVADRISRQPRSGIIRRAAIHTGNILDEGTCAHLACKSKWACRDDTNGITCPKELRNADATKKFRPLFACDNNCEKGLTCSDTGTWMAIPNSRFKSSKMWGGPRDLR